MSIPRIGKQTSSHTESRKASNWCSQFTVHCVLLTACLLSVITVGCGRQQEDETSLSEVVISVNNRRITLGEFQEAFKRLSLDADIGDDINDEELRELKIGIVNQLVEEELLLEEARSRGLEITENELAKEIGAIQKEYMGDAFESMIVSSYGSMDRWKEEIRNKLLVKKVIDEVIASKLVVREDEVRQYYKVHRNEYKVPEQIRARMIVVKTEEEANKVRERLKKGEDFAKVAREASLSPEGKKGGDLGFFGRGEMPKEFEDVVFSLPPGKISDVIKTAYGYHIFRVEEKKDPMEPTFSRVRDEITERLKREKSNAEFQVWMKTLKERAKIEIREDLL